MVAAVRQDSPISEPATFGQVLGKHVDAGVVTVKQMCDWLGGSEQTWYRTIHDERSPAWDVVTDNFETLPHAFQVDLLRQLLRRSSTLRIVTPAGVVVGSDEDVARAMLLQHIDELHASVGRLRSLAQTFSTSYPKEGGNPGASENAFGPTTTGDSAPEEEPRRVIT